MDTNIVVLALCHFFDLDLQELWIEIGTRNNQKWLPTPLYVETLHQEMYQALLFWFTLTGCDSVSMFASWRKKMASSVWQKYPEATQVFKRQNIVHQFITEAR